MPEGNIYSTARATQHEQAQKDAGIKTASGKGNKEWNKKTKARHKREERKHKQYLKTMIVTWIIVSAVKPIPGGMPDLLTLANDCVKCR